MPLRVGAHYTTKFTGQGMGLPIVLGLVQAHDGAITVDSELNRGSVFRIYLHLTPPTERRGDG